MIVMFVTRWYSNRGALLGGALCVFAPIGRRGVVLALEEAL